MDNHAIVAGALMDFVGFLTNRHPSVLVGTSGEKSGIYDSLEDFAKEVGLDLRCPFLGWQKTLGSPESMMIKSVNSCTGKPVVKILWGDDTVTYAHFSHEAELVHRMGAGIPTPRMGVEHSHDVKAPVLDDWIDTTTLNSHGYETRYNPKLKSYQYRAFERSPDGDGSVWNDGSPQT